MAEAWGREGDMWVVFRARRLVHIVMSDLDLIRCSCKVDWIMSFGAATGSMLLDSLCACSVERLVA